MKKILTFILLSCVCLFSACEREKESFYTYMYPEFTTEYTEEEHVERITNITEELFSAEFLNGEIADCNVEIVYAFYDNDPEYFLVELEYSEEFTEAAYLRLDDYRPITTKYKHFVGFIENDFYYSTSSYNDGFLLGKSSWNCLGYSEAKKYYGGGVHAVETEQGILQIYKQTGHPPIDSVEFSTKEYDFVDEEDSERDFQQSYLTEKMQETYMKSSHNRWREEYKNLIGGVEYRRTGVPSFQTKFTKEEHIEKITSITEELFAGEIANGMIADISVEILYSFYDHKPEFFLVEVEYDQAYGYSFEWEDGQFLSVNTKYKHIIGIIDGDEYYTVRGYNEGFMLGKSSWRYLGYTEGKKYYGAGMQAVETDEGFLTLFNQPEECIYSVEFAHYDYGFMDLGKSGVAFDKRLFRLNEQSWRRGEYVFSERKAYKDLVC